MNLFIKKRMKGLECLLNVGSRLFRDIGFGVNLKIYVEECVDQVEFTEAEYYYIQEYLI